MAEPSQHTSRLFLLDRKSGQKFLIDSGSEICIIPPSPTMNKSPQSNFFLFAANNTKIPAYGMVRKELNLGLRRPFIWTFIIADVSSPIIGADFLKHFNLLIDLKKKDANISFKNILSEYPDLSNPSLISKSASHGTVHHIITTGTPVTARPRRLHSKLYDAVKRCKQALADAALLVHPSPSAPLALHVDASDYAIGGALHQVVDSELQPLAFFSRKLTSSEKSYSAYTTVNSLAIYSAFRHFRQKSDKCSPRQIRQLDFISQFTTNIVHIPGSDNIAADVLSRVSAITFPSQIDYDCIAETQQTDQELHTLIASGTSLELKKVTFPNSSTEIMCDLSTGTVRPYIPKQHRQDVFSAMHNLSHPGIRRSVHLMKQRFVWPSISSDVAKWARHCLACQKSKIHRHTRSPLSSFQEPSQRFDHVHLDLIGPLPPSNGYTYCLTMNDRFSKWPETQPLKDITAETVAEAFFSSWVSRFGTPAILTTDRGRQFESPLFKALSKLLGVQKCRTTGYHPQANGMIEELHRPLKSAIKCHATERWTEVLPIILLGLRASLKEDILCTPVELVFGTTIRLPGEMFDSSKPDDDVVNFVSKYKSHMQSLHPKPPKHHGKRPVFIHLGLLEATHVFLRRDMLRRPLQQPYDGPFKVLQRKDKVFFLDINGKRVSVSIDRCKPAFFLNTEDLQLPQTKNETPATVEPNATASTPATVESDPTASTPTQPSHLHVLVAKFIFQLGIVDTGRGVCSDLTAPKLN
ncbi:transposon Tf2-11 polyprotein [Trichonephila clavipes]|nr:transposon Tf2-11 polyprotein [Trichonephila clavipes]